MYLTKSDRQIVFKKCFLMYSEVCLSCEPRTLGSERKGTWGYWRGLGRSVREP